jgi:glycosyltransferase involved in cell wall biosynthesis
MKILNHDYAGHAFQIELSRELARRGHEVIHAYNASDTTPKGPMVRHEDDLPNFQIRGLTLSETVAKGSLVKRWKQERAYAKIAVSLLREVAPDMVLSGNTPLDPQAALLKASQTTGVRFVYWLQDLTGIATENILAKKNPILGATIGKHYRNLEEKLLIASDGVIPISGDFTQTLHGMGVKPERTEVIENWAPLADITPTEKVNPWSIRNGLADKLVFLYSGAMGMKHNPELLVKLAKTFSDDPDVRIVVISQGIGADWLRGEIEHHGLRNMVLMKYQPYSELSQTLSSADVLVALLEPSAGTFSVPSKILSYHCAGRAILISVPPENLAARTVLQAGSGISINPDDSEGWIAAAKRLRANQLEREEFAVNAREMAEVRFAIKPIADRFEAFISRITPGR